jgi:hypothetical protein
MTQLLSCRFDFPSLLVKMGRDIGHPDPDLEDFILTAKTSFVLGRPPVTAARFS